MKKKILSRLVLKRKCISHLTKERSTGGNNVNESDFICQFDLTAATQCVPWGSCEGSQMECGGYC